MTIVQITPGAGGMYCGNCFKDNALVRALRQMGHETLFVPLYLPMTLEEEDQTQGAPVFYGGINVYLEQKFPWFGRTPKWFRQCLASPFLLKWAAGRAAKTRAADVGDLTVSMLEGESGPQAPELRELIGWIKSHHRPDIVCLSNALLLGLARKLREDLGAPVLCMLQGEDSFLDGLPDAFRRRAWDKISERAQEIDLFVAPSRYFAERMAKRMNVPFSKISVVYNGIDYNGFPQSKPDPSRPTLGYFARLCRDKGLDTLVDAFLILKKENSAPGLRLRVGGGLGPSDQAFVKQLQNKIEQAGFADFVEWRPNLDKTAKQQFFDGLSVFSVPARYGEAFGLYLLEAWASSAPVVQPAAAAFPELIEISRAGVLCKPEDPGSLALEIKSLLLNPRLAQDLGRRGREAVEREFNLEAMAASFLRACQQAISGKGKEEQINTGEHG